MKLRTIDDKTYDYDDADQKKEYYKHYRRNYQRQWYANNKEKAYAWSKAHLEKNKVVCLEKRRIYRANLPPEKKAELREKVRIRANERYKTEEEFAKKRIQTALDYYHNKGGKEKARERYVKRCQEKKERV